MRVVSDDLRWILSEVRYLRLEGDPFLRVFYPIEVDAALIGEGVEDVHVLNGLFTTLFVAVD